MDWREPGKRPQPRARRGVLHREARMSDKQAGWLWVGLAALALVFIFERIGGG
ncbi:MAG TPA: hypothetical protein VJS44_08190 [Pyrinomonadaceae bacterium]|nr:hypothetical protein [Pyrinomonadaceae bacterium]